MKPKVLGAIICVMIMVACPLVAVVADSEAADDSTGAATVKVTSINKTQADSLLGTNSILNMITYNDGHGIYYPLGLNTQIYSSSYSASTYEISGIDFEEGAKYYVNGDKTNVKGYEFLKMSCQFTFTFKMTSDGVKILGSSGGYQGDAETELLKKFGESTLKTDDIVKIVGKYSFIKVIEFEGKDVFHTSADKYFPTEYNGCQKYKNTHDVTVTIKDATFKDKYEFKQEIKSNLKYDFVNGEKIDYKYGKLEIASGSNSQKTQSSGTKTINEKSYGYESTLKADDGETKFDKAMSALVSDVPAKTNVQYTDLDYFASYSSDESVTKALDAISGSSYSHSPETFNKAYDPINSEASVSSGSSDNTMLIIGIVVAVVIVLALVALWYFKFRSPPASKTEDTPVQPEEPKNENQ